jgi:N6-adenosine-specific RNA methylase IME4
VRGAGLAEPLGSKRRYGLIHVVPSWDLMDAASPQGGRSDAAFAVDRLRRLPLADWGARSCALFLWVPGHLLATALRLVEDWGFRFQDIAFIWCRPHPPRVWGDRRPGRLMAEQVDLCLLGTRGAPRRQDARVHRLVHSPQSDRRPIAAYERMTRLIGDRPCLDIAARGTPLRGWDRWSPDWEAPEGNGLGALRDTNEQGDGHGGSAARGGG